MVGPINPQSLPLPSSSSSTECRATRAPPAWRWAVSTTNRRSRSAGTAPGGRGCRRPASLLPACRVPPARTAPRWGATPRTIRRLLNVGTAPGGRLRTLALSPDPAQSSARCHAPGTHRARRARPWGTIGPFTREARSLGHSSSSGRALRGPRSLRHAHPSRLGEASAELDAVSCSSSTACTAIGGGAGSSGLAGAHWDGHHWTSQNIPAPARANVARLGGISCPSRRDCIAIGQYENRAGYVRMWAEHWSGARWSRQTDSYSRQQRLPRVCLTSPAASRTACTRSGVGHPWGAWWSAGTESKWSIQHTREKLALAVSLCQRSTGWLATLTQIVPSWLAPSVARPRSNVGTGTSGRSKKTRNPDRSLRAATNELSGVLVQLAESLHAAVGTSDFGPLSESSEPQSLSPLVERWNGRHWSDSAQSLLRHRRSEPGLVRDPRTPASPSARRPSASRSPEAGTAPAG